jgi:hypothetical protein
MRIIIPASVALEATSPSLHTTATPPLPRHFVESGVEEWTGVEEEREEARQQKEGQGDNILSPLVEEEEGKLQ